MLTLRRSPLAGTGERFRARVAAADLFPPWWQLAGWTAGVAAASYLVRWLGSVDGRTFTVVWLAAAPQLVALLTSRRRHWPAYLVSFAIFQYGPAWLVLGQRPELAALSTLSAVLFAAWVLHPDQDWVSGHTDSLRNWRRFVMYGVVAAPAIAGVIGAISVVVHQQGPTDLRSLGTVALIWYLAEAVGIAFLTPVLLRWPRFRRHRPWRRLAISAGFSLLMIALCLVAAVESNFILLFLAGVPALIVLIEMGIVATFWQLAIAATIVLGSTFAGYGPFVAGAADPTRSMINAQVFLLAGYAMVVLVAAALEDRNRLSALDRASDETYDLIAKLTGDLVIVVDRWGDIVHNAFPGRSGLKLQRGPVPRSRWQTYIHPDDLGIVIERGKAGDVGPSPPFRVLGKDGTWSWFVMHSRRLSNGLSAAILRDVTVERELQDTLTDMALSDALTGLANRRALSVRTREIWLRAAELEQSVTALFVDVDHFKSFNDRFGHQAGDACLRDVAEVLQHLADPDSCVAARYGGEEFAVVLAGCADPRGFAAGVVSAIRALGIAHPDSPSGVVTVSIGVCTAHPHDPRYDRVDPDTAIGELLDCADKALYDAKSKGRDTISVVGVDDELVGKQVHHAREQPWQATGRRHYQ